MDPHCNYTEPTVHKRGREGTSGPTLPPPYYHAFPRTLNRYSVCGSLIAEGIRAWNSALGVQQVERGYSLPITASTPGSSGTNWSNAECDIHKISWQSLDRLRLES